MYRRDFLKISACCLAAGLARRSDSAIKTAPSTMFDHYFLKICEGYIVNCLATSGDFAVCDYPEGTKVKSCLTPSGHTYPSVARMLPAMAEWVAAAKSPEKLGEKAIDLKEALRQTFINAFDPKHANYWGEPPKDKATQRSVEAALVAEALWRLGNDFVATLSPEQRGNINQWLASCTVVPERVTNHAWFSAVNQAARLELGQKFPEFKGDEAWMLADLKAMDALSSDPADGWYSDAPDMAIYDYYNFWTFGNFPLLWARMIGNRYPDWAQKFRARSALFLKKTPYFFANNGAIPLMGRSLIYRWSLLSPMLLGYEQKLWPHSSGLLRKICRLCFEYEWGLGAYDEKLGKLRETYSSEGTTAVRENYIDNGHPYWTMLGFTFFSIPKDDSFWTAPEEPLPIERDDFLVKFPGPKMILIGTKSSGQVRWLQSQNAPKRDYYRDKYTKLSHSSHFPFNVILSSDLAPTDQALIFRDKTTGKIGARTKIISGDLTDNGLKTNWIAQLGDQKIDVLTEIQISGEFEHRTHTIALPQNLAPENIEIAEASFPLGLNADDVPMMERGDNWMSITNPKTNHLLMSWNLSGYSKTENLEPKDPAGSSRINLIYPRSAIIQFSTVIKSNPFTVKTLHYASPRPMPTPQILEKASQLLKI